MGRIFHGDFPWVGESRSILITLGCSHKNQFGSGAMPKLEQRVDMSQKSIVFSGGH
jgi:hypothetical protein